ncbi:MAG: lysophospholipid acyltransferase family protein [Vicinamibacterales bacterium]|nr:lysophospholipid acyltransferase family protein [Vicinamibacterales bacterium]
MTGLLPQRGRTAIAAVVADIFWFLARSKLRVTMTNLRLCFPHMTEKQRARIGRHSFRSIARAALDHSILWKADRATMERYIRVEGSHYLTDAANRPLILVMPHLLGIDAGGIGMCLHAKLSVVYSRQKNAVWEEWLRKARLRFNEPILFPRQDIDMRLVIRTLKDGIPLGYLPDVDLGPANSIFVPFFGVTAATIPMVSRLARVTGAKAAMAVTEMTTDGYVVHVEPPWQDFPGASVEEDTAHMNREIERWVRRFPEQYLWSQKRFRTRPPGEAPVY